MNNRSGGEYIYWLGGFGASGKTTAADTLAARLGYAVLHRDDVIADHERRLQASNDPVVQDFLKLRREGKYHEFLARDPEQVASDFISLTAEDFVLTLEDLEAKPPQVPTILEGTRLRADLLFKSLSGEIHVAWLRPTESMFGHTISSRPRFIELAQKLGPDGLRHLTRIFYFTSELQVGIAQGCGVGVVAIEAPTDYPKVPAEVARIWGVTVP